MERLLKISEDIQSEFNDGLLYGTSKSSIAMLPSYVPALPDGTGKNKNITPSPVPDPYFGATFLVNNSWIFIQKIEFLSEIWQFL